MQLPDGRVQLGSGQPRFGEADLTNCDREPIHIPGSIQPHGAMLIYDRTARIVTHASVNAAAMLGAADIIGRPLDVILGARAAHDVSNAINKSVAPSAPGLAFGLAVQGVTTRFDVAAHTHLGRIFIEFEPGAEQGDAYGPLELTRALSRRLADEKTMPGLSRSAARMVSAMLGYDRVMIYKLLHNGAGRVIAEHKRHDLNSFLGQHFPASDIPAQARELYKRNWIRMISDARYTPQPILPPIPQSQPPLDMSYAQLRSVSPVHCEYLQNMGVGASMSISILVEGELWGLIACHHYSPMVVPLPRRVGAELFGQFFSLQVETMERRERYDAANTARQRLDRIVAEISPEQDLRDSLSPQLADIRRLLPCDGAALWIAGAWVADGAVPTVEVSQPLIAMLDEQTRGEVWNTNHLAEVLPELAAAAQNVAGVMAVPISKTTGDYLLFFRSEESRFVEWAGAPEKIASGPLGDRLTPRKSFELWREEVRGQSTPWSVADLAIADAAQNYLRDVVLRHAEATSEERKRTEARRKLVNEELDHRVKNILALAKSIVDQSRAGASGVEGYADAVGGRLQALAFAHDQMTRNRGGGELRRLIEAEVAAYGGVRGAQRTTLQGPNILLGERGYSSLALVIHELATNAAKYGALSSGEGAVRVSWSITPKGDCELVWEEQGGPTVQKPQRAGFGSKLINQVVSFDLGGQADVTYPPTGLIAHFVIPERHVIGEADAVQITQQKEHAAMSTSSPSSLAGARVLLVEDQVLIAMDAEDYLRANGAVQVTIAPTSEAAMRQILAERPDIAVLDVNLGDHSSASVAEHLVSLDVPFVFATGYGDSSMVPETMRSVPVVRKPYTETVLLAALASALASKGK